MRVLIIDDCKSNLLILRKLIEQMPNCQSVAYDQPLAALRDAGISEIDLVLVDYMMPGLDGVSFIRRFRELPHGVDVPVIMITTSDEQSILHSALEAGATDFLLKPIETVGFMARVKNHLRLREAQNRLRDQAHLLANQTSFLEREVRRATEELAAREQEIIHRLSRAAEQRDNETGNHISRMAESCRLIAQGLGLPEKLCHDIYLAAPMHDVGKIGVTDAILLKPGRLSVEERRIMERHTLHGHQILSESKSELINLAAEMALSHHEWWNGQGYPRGLKGDEIPLCARIAAVADVFDALCSERPYKRPFSLAKARIEILAGAGTQFDPACVEAFQKRWHDITAIYENDMPEIHGPLAQVA